VAHAVHQQLIDQDFAAGPGIGVRAHAFLRWPQPNMAGTSITTGPTEGRTRLPGHVEEVIA
jgi:hypothetical protein